MPARVLFAAKLRSIAAVAVIAVTAFVVSISVADAPEDTSAQEPVAVALGPTATAMVLGAPEMPPREEALGAWHPPHVVKVWTTTHKGRVFRVTQLPHCEHLETVITYDPAGETLARAKQRMGGIAACTGSFHNSRTMALADFLQRNGSLISSARTGRSFVAIREDGRIDISEDYPGVKRNPQFSALALGQRLVPLRQDGFSAAFMNRVTDRMAIGLNSNFIFIVQGRSDIWRLADFIGHKLPVTTAINCDGGHVVRGKAPVHLVFRWRQ